MLVQSLTSLDVHNIRSHIWLESLLLTTCKIAPIARAEAAGVTEAEPQRRHKIIKTAFAKIHVLVIVLGLVFYRFEYVRRNGGAGSKKEIG